jgi:ASC-1-like (ASCH) protein
MTGDNSAPMEAPSAKAHRCEGGGAVDAVRGEREIVKKIFFTAKQIEEKQYGAILGFRGQTHKMLEKETGARIVLGGKGITLTDKAINLRNYERTQDMLNEKPHCRITAPSETSLQKCVERIEWILSDAVEAIKFRDKMRMQLAKDNGTFDAATWEPTPIPGQTAKPTANAAASAAFFSGAGGGGDGAAAADDDKDVNDVFAELDEL